MALIFGDAFQASIGQQIADAGEALADCGEIGHAVRFVQEMRARWAIASPGPLHHMSGAGSSAT